MGFLSPTVSRRTTRIMKFQGIRTISGGPDTAGVVFLPVTVCPHLCHGTGLAFVPNKRYNSYGVIDNVEVGDDGDHDGTTALDAGTSRRRADRSDLRPGGGRDRGSGVHPR